MAAIRREIKDVEKQYDDADQEYQQISKELRVITQERQNTEEELMVRFAGRCGSSMGGGSLRPR